MKNTALKRYIYSLLIVVISFSFTPSKSVALSKPDTVANKGFRVKTIVVDAGHGVRPPDEAGHFSPGASGSFSHERDVTLAIALKLEKAIEKEMNDVRVVLTRNTEQDVSWPRRAQIANENKGDLFISLHCNSLANKHIREVVGHKHHKPIYRTVEVPNRSGRGVLLLVYGFHRTKEEEKAIKETRIEDDSEMNSDLDPNDPESVILINEYKRKFRKQSIHLANLINTEFVEGDGRPSEGIREQGVLVLCHSAMPAVLVETGYINNPEDEAYLNSEEGQNAIVSSIVRAIVNYKKEVEQISE